MSYSHVSEGHFTDSHVIDNIFLLLQEIIYLCCSNDVYQIILAEMFIIAKGKVLKEA